MPPDGCTYRALIANVILVDILVPISRVILGTASVTRSRSTAVPLTTALLKAVLLAGRNGTVLLARPLEAVRCGRQVLPPGRDQRRP